MKTSTTSDNGGYYRENSFSVKRTGTLAAVFLGFSYLLEYARKKGE